MLRQAYYYAKVILLLAPCVASATTYYVRPGYSIGLDGTQTDINYGAEDGSSSAAAFDGFSDISGLAAGDVVCLPDSSEPFYEQLDTSVAGTQASYITFKSCGNGKALIWSAGGLGGNCSYNSSSAVVCSATYAWSTVNSTLYKKRIDTRPRMLWQDSTWLQPVNIDASSESTIDSTLTSGQWGVQNNGDSTYDVYYRPSNSCTPTTCVIRSDKIEFDDAGPAGILRVDKDYNKFQDIEVRGHTATATARGVLVTDATGTVLENIDSIRNQQGPAVTNSSNTVLRNVNSLYSSETGAYISPGTLLANLQIIGGSWSYTSGSSYNGTDFTSGDGDGMGIGQAGGTARDIVIAGIRAIDNVNAGVFVGTSETMTVTNFSFSGYCEGNTKNCFSEGSTAQIVGNLTLSGIVSKDTGPSTNTASINIGGAPPSARNVLLNNITFTGDETIARILFRPHANNNMVIRNIIFDVNPGATSPNYGDIYSNDTSLIGDEVFSHMNFNSAANTSNRFARIGTTNYTHNGASALSNFETATGSTNDTINTDPDLDADLQPGASTPSGIYVYQCRLATGAKCYGSSIKAGAYQSNGGIPYGYSFKPKKRARK